MVNDPRNKPLVAGDVFIREDMSRAYDSESIAVNGANSGTIIPVGSPINSDGSITVSLAITSILGFLLVPVIDDSSGTLGKFPILTKGEGIVVDSTMLPLKDTIPLDWGTVITDDMIAKGFIVRAEPATVSGPQVK